MSTDKPKGPGGFGGNDGDDDDLMGELEAWGNTFDGLHLEEEATGVRAPDDAAEQTNVHVPGGTPVRADEANAIAAAMNAPASHGSRQDDVLLAERAPAGGGVLDDDPFSVSLDAGGVGRPEIDFSDLGVDGSATALGSLLGVPPPLEPAEEVARRPEPPRRPGQRPSVVIPPLEQSSSGVPTPPDEEVYTSASRAKMAALPQGPTDDELFGDLMADDEPAKPAPSSPRAPVVPPRAPAGRTKPATIRRDVPRPPTAEDRGFGGADATRVADLGALEAQRREAVAERSRSKPDVPVDAGGGFGESTRVVSMADLEVQARRTARRTEPPPSAPARTGPAVIPRGQTSKRPPSDYDDDAFAPEPTKIADLGELERMRSAEAAAAASARALFDEQAPIELTVDEDFYDGFEIGDQAPASETSEPAASEPARRVTSHVVRRALPPTTPPPPGTVVMEIEAEASDEYDVAQVARLPENFPAGPDVAAPAPKAAEHDFSDVAAAVSTGAPVSTPLPRATSIDDALDALDQPESLGLEPPGGPASLADATVALAEDPAAAAEAARTAAAERAAADAKADADARAAEEARVAELALAAETRAAEAAEAEQARAVADAEAKVAAAAAAAEAAVVAAPDAAELPPPVLAGTEPELDLDAIALPELVDPTTAEDPAEAAARTILVYERELETVEEAGLVAALRCEAARLYERLGDGDRARHHYEAALLADPRSFTALRGLRRIARAAGELAEETRHLETELGIAGSLERRALALHRVDLLMAAGDQDLARVAVGELLDEAKGDVRALLAQLELAFLDGRVEELGESLERLASALGDADLRAALAVAAGQLQERPGGDRARARAAFVSAHEAALQSGDGASVPVSAGPALLGLRRTSDPVPAVAATIAFADLAGDAAGSGTAGVLLRTARVATAVGTPELAEIAAAALVRAYAMAPGDPLVAEAMLGLGQPELEIAALTTLGEVAGSSAHRTWALTRAATLRLARGGDGDADVAAAALARAAEADPTHDHVTAAHEILLAARGDWAAVAHLAVSRVNADPGAERDRVTAARALAAAGAIDQAVGVLAQGRALAPGSITLGDVLADALAVAGRWAERVELWAAIGKVDAEQLDPELSALRAASAAEEAVAAAAPAEADDDDEGAPEHVTRAITAALDAWSKVLEYDAESARAHSASIALARRLGDRDVLADALARAQAARTGAVAVTLGLERVRGLLDRPEPDLGRAEEILGELGAGDPRRLAAAVIVAVRAGRWADAAQMLEERATVAAEAGATLEAVSLRYRAAQLLLDRGDDVTRAAQLLVQVLEDRPGLTAAADALSAARRRIGGARGGSGPISVRSTAAELGTGADAFARLVREAELSASGGDAHGAISLLQRALELRPSDPLAALPLIRIARAAGEPAPLTALALAELRHADDANDAEARADAYEVLARIDAELRNDAGSALMGWESAATASPRPAVLHEIARAYAVGGKTAELYAVRGRQLEAMGGAAAPDAVALGLDRAALAEKEGLDDDEIRRAYQDVVSRDRKQRIALFHLEALVRRAGSSAELAALEESIAELFADDVRARASFLTRSGETLAELGQLETAIERFKAADAVAPGWVPALQGWRLAALRGGLWIDVAEAASREAASLGSGDDAARQRAALYHLAGVALMDRALIGERAVPLFRKALAADPRHHDAFVRVRILLEEQGDHDELAQLLEERLVHEEAPPTRIALHRALAELYRNFLGDRESAKLNFRAILEQEPNDLRAVASLSDICWEQGAWAEAAEALVARARLERDPRVLRNLFYRLGTIYAERIPQPQLAIKAFQRVLSFDPEDHDALIRLADLGIAAAEWKMALGACERLVKAETDPDQRVAHFHRVGRIFLDGFHDRAKAERAFRMALDSAPASDAALAKLVEFYQQAGDLRSVRVHLDRVAQAMRAKLEHDPADGVAARVIARTMAARQGAGVVGSIEVARNAAELATALGAADDDDRNLAAQVQPGNLAQLVRPEADDLIFSRAAPGELRQIFALLGERLAKHVGVDLRPYGVTRGDRLRAGDDPVASVAQEVAAQLGLGEIDVYVSQKMPLAMQAEPTSPVSLVIGAQIAGDRTRGDARGAVRFAAGAALKLAQAHLALAARLPTEELGALVVALLRLFQPEFPYLAVDQEAVAGHLNKLKRLIPSGLLTELRPYALAINAAEFDHRALQRAVLAGGLRAGLRACGSLGVGLQVLAARQGVSDLGALLRDPASVELVTFAIGEDHARLVQLG